MQVIVDDILTSYKKYGSGKKIILCLHGWGDSSKGFEALGPFSSDKYTTIFLDLPGFGGTARPPSIWGLPEYAEFVGKFTQKIKLPPHVVLGHSNGGAIAVLAVSSKIIEPDKLILIASSGIRSVTSLKKTFHKFLAKIARLLIFILPEATQKKIKRKLYARIGSDYMVVDGLQETFKKIISYDVTSDAQKITIPALLIYGSNDLITPVWQAKKIAAAIADSKLEIIDGAEHFPHKDQPKKVREMVEEFIK